MIRMLIIKSGLHTVRTKAKECIRSLVSADGNVRIRLSSSLFPPPCSQLKLDARSRLFHLLILPFYAWTITSNGVSFLGFRALVAKQLADLFPGKPFLNVVHQINLPHKHYLSLHSDINRSTPSFDRKPICTTGKWKGMTEIEERTRTEAKGWCFNISCPHCARNFFAVQFC
jgi:hypothetical protein